MNYLRPSCSYQTRKNGAFPSGQISKREPDMLRRALAQGSYVDPQIDKHITFHHWAVRNTYPRYIIRAFVQQLSLTQDIVASDHDVARYATGEWTPTIKDIRHLFNALDELANKLDEGRRDMLQQKCGPKYSRSEVIALMEHHLSQGTSNVLAHIFCWSTSLRPSSNLLANSSKALKRYRKSSRFRVDSPVA
jgi:hypothetical protein